MSYLPFTILAYFLNGTSLLIDKFLLTKSIPNPLTYVFYISATSLLVLLISPFTKPPSSLAFILASASTLFWTAGIYFMFKALQVGLLSRVIPVIGTLTPLLLLASQAFNISVNERWAAGILILGLLLVTLKQWHGRINRKEMILEVLAALLFSISYLLLRQAYLTENFLTVLVHSRWILIPLGIVILVAPNLRKQILIKVSGKFLSRAGALFVFGQTLGGVSQLLLTFSISLTSPALVSSLQGVQYVFLFLASLFLAKKLPEVFKKERKIHLILKIAGIALIGFGLYILAFVSPKDTKFGVTYSYKYARDLRLDEKATFVKILDDLQVKSIRLPVYWDEIEPFPQKFNFGSIDFYLNEALKKEVEVILILGHKQPRWPECFTPLWVQNLTRQDREARIVELILQEVEHFKQYPNIKAWQIENEPFLSYGVCDSVDNRTHQLLKKEIAAVKSLDRRPIIITDSGELSSWMESIKYSDWFGFTLYRTVWTKHLGLADYPLPPFFYSVKERIVRTLTGKAGTSIISELQAEPWTEQRTKMFDNPSQELAKLMPVSKLAGNIDFAKEVGFREAYLWGVEWWYYMAQSGHPEYLEFAKGLF